MVELYARLVLPMILVGAMRRQPGEADMRDDEDTGAAETGPVLRNEAAAIPAMRFILSGPGRGYSM